MLEIHLDKEAEEIGFACMIADLIRQNMEQHPEKARDFIALGSAISIEARDAEVTITLVFRRGSLYIYNGVHGFADISLSSDSATILELSLAKMLFGLPNLLDSAGRKMVKKILTGELKVGGLLRRPGQLVRLTRLMSVNA
jgi:hypothetical protein